MEAHKEAGEVANLHPGLYRWHKWREAYHRVENHHQYDFVEALNLELLFLLERLDVLQDEESYEYLGNDQIDLGYQVLVGDYHCEGKDQSPYQKERRLQEDNCSLAQRKLFVELSIAFADTIIA